MPFRSKRGDVTALNPACPLDRALAEKCKVGSGGKMIGSRKGCV